MEPTLYFAYGSNLSLKQMQSRCPTSPYLGLGVLKGWKWIIGERGYANVVKCPASSSSDEEGGEEWGEGWVDVGAERKEEGEGKEGGVKEGREKEDVVYGMLYVLSERDEKALDLAEGVPYAYTKHILPIQPISHDSSGKEQVVKALVYVDEHRLGEGEIKEEYVKRMNRGIKDARENGMPGWYAERVLRKWIPVGDGDGDEGEVEDPFHPGREGEGEEGGSVEEVYRREKEGRRDLDV